eukprot:6191721-Pleurochrysis_carterae.AAC.2
MRTTPSPDRRAPRIGDEHVKHHAHTVDTPTRVDDVSAQRALASYARTSAVRTQLPASHELSRAPFSNCICAACGTERVPCAPNSGTKRALLVLCLCRPHATALARLLRRGCARFFVTAAKLAKTAYPRAPCLSFSTARPDARRRIQDVVVQERACAARSWREAAIALRVRHWSAPRQPPRSRRISHLLL